MVTKAIFLVLLIISFTVKAEWRETTVFYNLAGIPLSDPVEKNGVATYFKIGGKAAKTMYLSMDKKGEIKKYCAVENLNARVKNNFVCTETHGKYQCSFAIQSSTGTLIQARVGRNELRRMVNALTINIASLRLIQPTSPRFGNHCF